MTLSISGVNQINSLDLSPCPSAFIARSFSSTRSITTEQTIAAAATDLRTSILIRSTGERSTMADHRSYAFICFRYTLLVLCMTMILIQVD